MSDTANKQPDNQQPDAYQTDMPVGEILRRGREHYGQSLAQVEANLRIRAIQLKALEEGNVDQLPGKAYALGFVRSYSEYLGLDGDKMVQLYKKQTLGNKIQPDLHFPVAASDSKLPTFWLAVGLALIGVVLIGFWAFYNQEDRSDLDNVPPVAEVIQEDPVGPPAPTPDQIAKMQMRKAQMENLENGAAETVAGAEGTETATTATTSGAALSSAAASEKEGIILNIVENSWVEIRDASGKAIVSRVLKAGEQYFVPDRPDLRMNLGNASGVEIVMDGKALPVLGRRGQVRRNISLDSKSLKALAEKAE